MSAASAGWYVARAGLAAPIAARSRSPAPETGETGDPERGRFLDGRDIDRDAEEVRLSLHEVRVGGHAAIDPQSERRFGQDARHRLDHVGDPLGDAIERGAHDMRRVGLLR